MMNDKLHFFLRMKRNSVCDYKNDKKKHCRPTKHYKDTSLQLEQNREYTVFLIASYITV